MELLRALIYDETTETRLFEISTLRIARLLVQEHPQYYFPEDPRAVRRRAQLPQQHPAHATKQQRYAATHFEWPMTPRAGADETC